MLDLKEALIRDFGPGFDKQAEQANNIFISNKDSWIKSAAEDYIKYDVDPNVSLSKFASSYNLNEEQIKRMVEETNVAIYLRKYAGLRDSVVRDVTFPLADVNKILNPSVNNPVAVAPDVSIVREASFQGSMSKVASTNIDRPSINFLNSSGSYEPSLWGDTIEKNAAEILRRNALALIHEALDSRSSRELDIVNKIATLGNALLHQEKLGESAQQLLDKIAADADWYGDYQTPVLRYVNKVVDLYKEASRLPQNFSISVTYSQPQEANPYSLGSHSLLEKSSAELVVNVDKMPENISYDELVTFAQVLKKEIDKNPPPKTSRPIKLDEVL